MMMKRMCATAVLVVLGVLVMAPLVYAGARQDVSLTYKREFCGGLSADMCVTSYLYNGGSRFVEARVSITSCGRDRFGAKVCGDPNYRKIEVGPGDRRSITTCVEGNCTVRVASARYAD